MGKNPSANEIAQSFATRLEDDTLISSLFNHLGFDCTLRCFLDPGELDESIGHFLKERTVGNLVPIIELIQKSKRDATLDENALIKDIKTYVEQTLNENVSIEQVARTFHISYYYLSHLFKEKTNRSFQQFKTEKRLKKAMRLLVESHDKIADVATACGFENSSYFAETFIKFVGDTPTNFRKRHNRLLLHPFYDFEDMLLAAKMDCLHFLQEPLNVQQDDFPFIQVHNPEKKLGEFLHETAIVEYEGVLYASWYNGPKKDQELTGYTPIVERRSYDGGLTWTSPRVIVGDVSEKLLYCPPVYGICDDNLYMLINEMVSADHMHALDLYVLNKQTDTFERLWSRPIPFKLNTNVVTLPNGKLILPGRIAELDGFPNTPAVMISDNGKIDAPWRVVRVAKNGDFPDGESLIHPETTLICCDDTLYLFNRNDKRSVPLVYISKDYGETWSAPMSHDIPYRNSKIYSGTLSDGRHYIIATIDRVNRTKLALYVSDKDTIVFRHCKILMDCEVANNHVSHCHYPAAYESDGVLYIIATAVYDDQELSGRGAVLFKVDLKTI